MREKLLSAAAIGVLGISPFLPLKEVAKTAQAPDFRDSLPSAPLITIPHKIQFGIEVPAEAPTKITVESISAPLWEKEDRPSFVAIPTISFVSSEVQLADLTPDGQTYTVPDAGIATPRSPHAGNFLYIYGHSRWKGEDRSFANISNLEPGDSVFIGKEGKESVVEFIVESFRLVNLSEDTSSFWYFTELALLLQTTAKAEGEWILDRDRIIQNSGENVPQSLEGYLVYAVVAKPLRILEEEGGVHTVFDRANLPIPASRARLNSEIETPR